VELVKGGVQLEGMVVNGGGIQRGSKVVVGNVVVEVDYGGRQWYLQSKRKMQSKRQK
jgi:hypothetical protein